VARALQQRLRTLETPLPRPGYAERVLSGARRTQRVRCSRSQVAAYALAASLAVAVAVGWLLWQRPAPSGPAPSQVVTVQGNAVQPVRLVFNSPTALSGVTLRVGLPEGVELAEYPGMRELTWKADLKSGPNLLELPVVVHGRGGLLVASVSYGAEQRQFSVLVQASSPSSYAPGYVPADTLAWNRPGAMEPRHV
jgi:hypothetical protein